MALVTIYSNWPVWPECRAPSLIPSGKKSRFAPPRYGYFPHSTTHHEWKTTRVDKYLSRTSYTYATDTKWIFFWRGRVWEQPYGHLHCRQLIHVETMVGRYRRREKFSCINDSRADAQRVFCPPVMWMNAIWIVTSHVYLRIISGFCLVSSNTSQTEPVLGFKIGWLVMIDRFSQAAAQEL